MRLLKFTSQKFLNIYPMKLQLLKAVKKNTGNFTSATTLFNIKASLYKRHINNKAFSNDCE